MRGSNRRGVRQSLAAHSFKNSLLLAGLILFLGQLPPPHIRNCFFRIFTMRKAGLIVSPCSVDWALHALVLPSPARANPDRHQLIAYQQGALRTSGHTS